MTSPDGVDRPDTDRAEVLAFAAHFRGFLFWVHSEDAGDDSRNEVAQLVALDPPPGRGRATAPASEPPPVRGGRTHRARGLCERRPG